MDATTFTYISPPGDTLLETLEAIGMSQSELSERMGRPEKTISAIVNGKSAITPETALQLESVLGISAQFWLAREQHFQEANARLTQKQILAQYLTWLKLLPLPTMKKHGWIRANRDKIEMLTDCLSFFGVASPDQWSEIWLDNPKSVSFRMSLAFTSKPGAVATWIRHGERVANDLDAGSYDKLAFIQALHRIRAQNEKWTHDFQQQLRDECMACGVKVIYSPQIPGAQISGMARWFAGSPMIQLSDRYKSHDQFWFTFFHEAAHIVLHGKRDIFIDGLEGSPIEQFKEDQANQFAQDMLIDAKAYDKFVSVGQFYADNILLFALTANVHPGVVVARLQREQRIEYKWHNELKGSIALDGD